jgi:3-dehydroquinate dehydratase-2
MASAVLILNGPNLNMLGSREPDLYGAETLEDIAAQCTERGAALGLEVDFRQSNTEGELVDWIQQASAAHAGLILNAGAYTHTSIAILDALRAASVPIIEVHLSNIFQREEYRRHSYVSEAAGGVICGFGGHGYLLALEALARILEAGAAGS